MSSSDDLQRAYQLIREGSKAEAAKMLIEVVRRDQDNADAWWLLANAVPNADQSRRALKQVLRIRPNSQQAQRMLAQLQGRATEEAPARSVTPRAQTTFDDAPPTDPRADPFGPRLGAARRGAPTRNDDPLAPPRAASRQAGRAPVDDDLAFDDDPFAGVTGAADDDPFADLSSLEPLRQPQTRSRPPRRAPERAVPQDRRSAPPGRGRPSGRSGQAAKGGTASRGRSGAPNRPPAKRQSSRADITVVADSYTGSDPFGDEAVRVRPQRGDPVIFGLLIILLGGIGLLAVLLLNNRAGTAPTADTQGLRTPGVVQDSPLGAIALTALADPNAASDAVATIASDPVMLATLLAQATIMPGVGEFFNSNMGSLMMTAAVDPGAAGGAVATLLSSEALLDALGAAGLPGGAMVMTLLPPDVFGRLLGSGGDPNLIATSIAQLERMGVLAEGSAAADLSSATPRGTLEIGAAVRETVDTFVDDSWKFAGRSGDALVIALDGIDDQLDPQLSLYDPDNLLLSANDDIDFRGGNLNARIEVTLPKDGTYTLVVSAFGEGGRYELRIARR